MALQKIIRPSLTIFLRRNYSASSNLINLTKNDETGTSTVTMNRPPLNALNREFLLEFRETLQKVQENDSTSVILTSSVPNIFTAGIELTELYTTDMVRLREFWNELQETWLKLYGLSIPTAAAINGSSPAAGCAFALACDHRVFVNGNYEMGFNETKIGMRMPQWFEHIMTDTIGHRRSEKALLKGELFSPEEALKIGLVDELATNEEDAIAKCQKYLDDSTQVPAVARAAMKQDIREARIKWLEENRNADYYRFTGFNVRLNSEVPMRSYMETLMKKN